MTSAAKAEGRFYKADFVYRRASNYLWPAGERAIWRFSRIEGGIRLHRYWSLRCPRCPLKEQCTPSNYRRISRWEHQEVLDAMERRLDQLPDSMRIRRQTTEHCFGTLKLWKGSAHFLTRRLANVRTEMILHLLAHNLKRVTKILGTGMRVPANRLGSDNYSASELKGMQEVITLVVFAVVVAALFGQPLKWNLYAGFVLVAA